MNKPRMPGRGSDFNATAAAGSAAAVVGVDEARSKGLGPELIAAVVLTAAVSGMD